MSICASRSCTWSFNLISITAGLYPRLIIQASLRATTAKRPPPHSSLLRPRSLLLSPFLMPSVSLYLPLSAPISLYLHLSLSASLSLFLSVSLSISLYLSLSPSMSLYLSRSISLSLPVPISLHVTLSVGLSRSYFLLCSISISAHRFLYTLYSCSSSQYLNLSRSCLVLSSMDFPTSSSVKAGHLCKESIQSIQSLRLRCRHMAVCYSGKSPNGLCSGRPRCRSLL